MGEIVRLLAIGWIALVIGFSGGVYVYRAQVWPYPVIKEIEDFLLGHSEETTSLWGKILNDLNLEPARHSVKAPDRASNKPISYRELENLPLNPRRINPLIFLSDSAPRGYRLIYGTFDFQQNQHGAVLLGPEAQVEHLWMTTQEDVKWDHRPDTNVFPHGIAISSDGSILVAFDEGSSLSKYDYCNRKVWSVEGNFNHAITFVDEQTFWAWEGVQSVVHINYEDGEVLKKFHLLQVIDANQDIDILGIRQQDGPESSKWEIDPWHGNDVDPLPKALDSVYPGFNAGDLLMSLRSSNLILVLNPENLKVKWWRQGLTRRQHDPDWNPKGTITVLDNNMHRGHSHIVEIDPVTMKSHKIVDGKVYDFYTWRRGKHQFLAGGAVLVTSTEQGRVFEVDNKGNITFEFINRVNTNNERMVLSEALFLPMDFFRELPHCPSLSRKGEPSLSRAS